MQKVEAAMSSSSGASPLAITVLSLLLLLGISERILTETKRELENVPRQDETSRSFVALPSGWDAAGFQLYKEKKDELTKAVIGDPTRILMHRVAPLEAVRTVKDELGKWAPLSLGQGEGMPKWEPETFTDFFKHLSSSGCRYYVGFGTWIGPTLFYAAQLVDEAYGIEADPVAFARVETNAALNRATSWERRIHLSPHAIGLGSSDDDQDVANVKMISAGAGNSMSGIGAKVHKGENVSWMVNAYPLPFLLRRWNVPATQETFIKVDVESFECQLVPSWLPWVETMGEKKPTFHLSMHINIAPCSKEEYGQIFRFAELFDHKDEGCMDFSKKVWTCGKGEFVFHDSK